MRGVRTVALRALQAALGLGGVGLGGYGGLMVAAGWTTPGFPAGLAFVFGLVLFVAGLAGVGLAVALPTLVGEGVLFRGWQRRVLGAGGTFLVGGLALGVVVLFAAGATFALAAWGLATLLGVLAVALAVAWRAGEAVLDAAVVVAGRD